MTRSERVHSSITRKQGGKSEVVTLRSEAAPLTQGVACMEEWRKEGPDGCESRSRGT